MPLKMGVAITTLCESPIANLTLERAIGGVGCQVIFHIAELCEYFAAVFTLKFFVEAII